MRILKALIRICKHILEKMQNNNIKISIIMPVYNVEEYLPKSIESVLNQTLNEFELILVDDGSKDLSGKICDEYAAKDKRVKVLHQVNSGAHTARNNALKIATGTYVCFFDSDDYIDKNMLEELHALAIKYDSDLVISGFYIETYYDDNNYSVFDYIPYTLNGEEVENFSDCIKFRKNAYFNFDRNMFYPPWNKLYKLEYLNKNNITFPKTYRDDFPFVLSVIKDISNVTYTKKQYYHFIRKRTESETQKYIENLYTKREEEHNQMVSIFTDWNLYDDKNSLEMICRRYIDRIIECMVNLFNRECKLCKKDKQGLIYKYINTKQFDNCITKAKPKTLYLRIIYLILKTKNVNICYAMSKFINFVKANNLKLFSILKNGR